jgi:preprotein translocase subunit SecF
MINILGKRYYFFALSLLIIIPGLILLGTMAATGKLPLAIDFTGGSLLEVRFSNATPTEVGIINLYKKLGVEDVKVQTTSSGSYVIRSTVLEDSTRAKVADELSKEMKSEVTVLRFESVGPTIGREVTSRAAQAVAVAAIIVTAYMTFAFRGVPSLTAIGSALWGWQIDSMFLTALLTVIGFSVQDKVVVFDRIRENTGIYRRLSFENLVNHSIVQTLGRSLNTQLMTVEFMLLALALFGGVTLREFATILLVGLFSGTYSSIFIAAPILVVWESREWTRWFRPRENSASA